MAVTLTASAVNRFKNRSIDVRFKYDNQCYRCGISLSDQTPIGFYSENDSTAYIYLLFACPTCHQFSIFEYTVRGRSPLVGTVDLCNFSPRIYPCKNFSTSFPKEIVALSGKFAEIYHQAEIAETNGLTEICGMGYRKALEFLIKDYLSSRHPEKTESIVKQRLGDAIQGIDDSRIKTLASRSTWLANDECHYIQKWEEYDIEDLKRFINALIYFLESELTFEEALAMQRR